MALLLTDLQTSDSGRLMKFIKRRHPEYKSNLDHWSFLELSYRGGRDWIDKNIFSYHKEGRKEFRERKKRAYRFPHAREVISLVNKYVFKGAIDRRSNVPNEIKSFWNSSTVLKRPIADLMESISIWSSTFGRVWVVVDNNIPADVKSIADRKASKGRVYAYFLKPTQVYDFEYDEDGELEWIMFGEFSRDKSNPLDNEGKVVEKFRVWTKEFTCLIECKGNRNNETASLDTTSIIEHGLGIVPVFPADHIAVEELYSSQGLIEDAAYLDRAVANYLSNLDVIIQDQTFSQLAIPFQGLLQSAGGHGLEDEINEDAEAADQMHRMGTKRIFGYNAEGGAAPAFISPDVKQADLIMRTITKLVGEIYHSIGMAGERTKEDNAAGIDNSSGVAKAYDFEKLNAMLAAKARSLQNIERNLVRLVMAWNGKVVELEDTPEFVSYPTSFDVRSLTDEMDNAQRLSVINGPKEIRRLQMKRLVRKMFPQIEASDLKRIDKEIDVDWLELDPLAMISPAGPGDFPATGRVPGKNGSQGENNKGSVKADDKAKEIKAKAKPKPKPKE